MKTISIVPFPILLFILLISNSCSSPPTQQKEAPSALPDNMIQVLNQHGGLKQWQSLNCLSFEMGKGEGRINYKVDLIDRREKVVGFEYSYGFDGKNYWHINPNNNIKAGPRNVIFYKGLMFYFLAMPFVLADEGIQYEEIPNLEFEGKSYPGIRISYQDQIGLSPEDEYFLHYDPQTHQMVWLGYTVTHENRGDNAIHWIKYEKWKEFNGVMLAPKLTWYTLYHKDQDNKPHEVRHRQFFRNIQVTQEACEVNTFTMPEDAQVIKAK